MKNRRHIAINIMGLILAAIAFMLVLCITFIDRTAYANVKSNSIASPTPYPTIKPDQSSAQLTYTGGQASQKPLPHNISIVFCGDIMLDGSVRNIINKYGLDSVFPKEYRTPFQNADITMIDLEMPISNKGIPVPDKEYTYRGDPSGIELLKDMGVNIVTLANNHTLDYGQDAFMNTIDLLNQNGIKHVGGGKDLDEAKQWVTMQAGDKKVAFLAASRVIPALDWYATKNRPGLFGTYDPTELNKQIDLAKKEADYVVVFAHWGVEKNTVPEKYQQNLAHGYIDAGADLVVACHTHVLQSFEYYKDKLIAYSLGNFIFTDVQKDTAALEINISDNGSVLARIYPYEITNRTTAPMTDPYKLANLRKHLNNISFGLEVDEKFMLIKN